MSRTEQNATPDGRKARGENNRRKIVAALIDLIREGTISPSAEDVAARADVGLRTVFRHFDDMDGLYREVSEHMTGEIRPLAEAPIPPGDWPSQIEAVVARRARVFERMMPFKTAADVHRHRSPFLTKEHEELVAMQRDMLEDLVPREIKRDKTRLEALDLILSFDSWRRLRRDQRLSVDAASRAVVMAVRALTT